MLRLLTNMSKQSKQIRKALVNEQGVKWSDRGATRVICPTRYDTDLFIHQLTNLFCRICFSLKVMAGVDKYGVKRV